jgi:hypothetical protein
MKAEVIIGAVEGVTKKWATQRKREERDARAREKRQDAWEKQSKTSIKDAANEVMERAYLHASDGGTLPANARQIMYSARPYVQEATGKKLSDQYFIQTLLVDYMKDHDCDNWDVVFDARGHFYEPHTDLEVPLGTLDVRRYLADVRSHAPPSCFHGGDIIERYFPTVGPRNRYGAILFIEKEGFGPLFKAVRLAERYDIAIMSTKGQSVTASRLLVDRLCAEYNIPLLVLHDFDKSGFSIFGTIGRSNRRYEFENKIEVIDLGLRLEDVDGLEKEAAFIPRGSFMAARKNLKKNGATPEEIEFLLKWRVELNAFPSRALVSFVEAKLDALGIQKINPEQNYLEAAFRRIAAQRYLQKALDDAEENARQRSSDLDIPEDLRAKVQEKIDSNPTMTWDDAVGRIVRSAMRHSDE